jgi:hypothetical protein
VSGRRRASSGRAAPRASYCALALYALLAFACRAPTAAKAPEPEPALSAPIASWRGTPVSWEKLGLIERWLADAGITSADPELVAQAELELAQGRLFYARHEREKISAEAFRQRIEAAESGLRNVLRSEHATVTQRADASRSLGALLALRAAPAPPAGPNPPRLITRAVWGALPGRTAKMDRNVGAWQRITVHHSADYNGERAEQSANESVQAVRSIQRFHMQGNRWGDIGYHFLIDPQGRVYEGRSLNWQGAHAGDPARNRRNIGICVLGDYSSGKPPAAAVEALANLIDWLVGKHSIARNQIYGHLELKSGTACPGPALLGWVEDYRGARPGSAKAALASSSTKSSSETLGAQPSASKREASPRNSSASPARVRSGSGTGVKLVDKRF